MTLVYLVSGNVYAATFLVSIGLSLVVFWLALTRAMTPAQINRTFYRNGGMLARLEQLSAVRDDGTPSDAAGVHPLKPPLGILFPTSPDGGTSTCRSIPTIAISSCS